MTIGAFIMNQTRSGSIISSLTLAGRVWGEVRRLEGFDKKRHTLPDKVNGATQAFLAKLCSREIEEDGEALFQRCRKAFGYRRKDLSLSAGNGHAQLETKDFQLELRCDFDPDDPSRYYVETEVTRAASRDLLESAPFSEAIGDRFDRLRCGLGPGVSVAAVIDAVEEDASGELAIDYPSDCSQCEVRIGGVNGLVVVDGMSLEVRYPRLASAGELMAGFERIGERFAAADGLGILNLEL